MSSHILIGLLFLLSNSTGIFAADKTKVTVYTDLVTDKGTITVGLNGDAAPGTVNNFLQYVNAGLYADSIFHRLVPNFALQGGGVNVYGKPISTFAPIANEAGTSGLSNVAGTIAMARTNDPNSATSQFFFNLVDNSSVLDYGSVNAPAGYAVFGAVVAGAPVVATIAALTPFNSSSTPFPVSPSGQMVLINGAYGYSLAQAAIPRLRILITGNGSGTVRTQPGGVCNSGMCPYTVKTGQKISLKAISASNSYFAGWSGDCVGGNAAISIVTSKATPSSTNCVANFQTR